MKKLSFYDHMAYLIRVILNNVNEQFYIDYSVMSPDESKTINTLLTKRFPELMEEGNPTKILTPTYCPSDLSKRLNGFIAECIEKKDMISLTRLLRKMDVGLATAVKNFTTMGEISGLNRNHEEVKIQILPKCSCGWSHRNKDVSSSNCLNNFLSHFYYIDEDELLHKTGYKVRHSFLSAFEFEKAAEKDYLKVGISPISDQIKLNIKTNADRLCTFQVNSISDEDLIINNVLSVLERAKHEKVNILCFPEMLGTPAVNQAIQEKLQEYPDESGLEYPALTVCPSNWINKMNASMVLDKMGNIICIQNKQHPFIFEYDGQKYKEDIKGDGWVHLIHCEGIGRIAIMICKDALMREYVHSLLSILKITLLIVPSFSTGSYDFDTNLSVCEGFDCNVVWVNTCSARLVKRKGRLEMVGFVKKTGKITQIENGKYTFECKKGTERGNCYECLFTETLYYENILRCQQGFL